MPFTTPQKKRAVGGDGASAAPAAPSGGAAQPTQATPGYVDFSRILAANQQGAQSMADAMAGKVSEQGQQASSAIDAAHKGFQSQVQAGTNTYSRPMVGAGSTSTAPLAQQYQQAGAIAGAAAGRGYTGPKDYQGAGVNTAQLSAQAASAQDAVKNLATPGGRAALLQPQASPNYTAGMAGLDSALAGAALGSRPSDLGTLYGGLSQRLSDYQTQDSALATSAQQSSEAAQDTATADAADFNRRAREQAANTPPQAVSGTPAVGSAGGSLDPGQQYDYFLGVPVGRRNVPKTSKKGGG